MAKGPLSRTYGLYNIVLRKIDHVGSGRPTPHIEVWKGRRKVGNYDMATGRGLTKTDPHMPNDVKKNLSNYLNDEQVQRKIMEMIEASYFDLSKAAGDYGGKPRGFKVVISVEYVEPNS